MKMLVATIDRGEKRAMPQIPCPLVHPDPKNTPNPTMSPPIASADEDTGTTKEIVPPNETKINGERTAPEMNAARHAQSLAKGGINPVTIPVTPAMRP